MPFVDPNKKLKNLFVPSIVVHTNFAPSNCYYWERKKWYDIISIFFQQLPLSSIEECATPTPLSTIEHVNENDSLNCIVDI